MSAEFNRDGKLDLAGSYFNLPQVGVYLGGGNGTFVPFAVVNLPDRSSLGTGDFDADGNPDLVVVGGIRSRPEGPPG